MVDVVPIRNDQGYEAALREIETLMMARPGTHEGDRLETLVALVQAYEAAHHAIEASDSKAR